LSGLGGGVVVFVWAVEITEELESVVVVAVIAVVSVVATTEEIG
jgi:hypothetical protein